MLGKCFGHCTDWGMSLALSGWEPVMLNVSHRVGTQCFLGGFPGGSVVKTLPANAGDVGLIPVPTQGLIEPRSPSLQADPLPTELPGLKGGPGNRGRSACGPTHVARLEFPRETGLILRCAGMAGNPFQTTQGNHLSCRDDAFGDSEADDDPFGGYDEQDDAFSDEDDDLGF